MPVRKHGKLPGPTHAQSYELEYGSATIEVHTDAFQPGERVLIVDDVLATGGTAAATAELVQRSGAQIAAIAVLIELSFLSGRGRLGGLDVRSLLVGLTVSPRAGHFGNRPSIDWVLGGREERMCPVT